MDGYIKLVGHGKNHLLSFARLNDDIVHGDKQLNQW